jgi:hypothetical protein
MTAAVGGCAARQQPGPVNSQQTAHARQSGRLAATRAGVGSTRQGEPTPTNHRLDARAGAATGREHARVRHNPIT